MTRPLFLTRARLVAVLTIVVTSLLLIWGAWASLSTPRGASSSPGIVMTAEPASASSTSASPSPSPSTTPEATTPEPVEPAAPADVDPGGQVDQPQAPADDDDYYYDDDDDGGVDGDD